MGVELVKGQRGTFRIAFYTPFRRAGLIDTSGKVIIPFQYRNVFYDSYYSGRNRTYYLAKNLDGKFGAINKHNEIVIPFEFDKSPYPYPDNQHLRWEKGDKCGLSNSSGMVLQPEFSSIRLPFNNPAPYLIAEQNNFCYFIFLNGKKLKKNFVVNSYTDLEKYIIIEAVQSEDLDSNIWIREKGRFTSKEKNKKQQIIINNKQVANIYFGVFDTAGKEILPLVYDTIEYFRHKDKYLVKKDGKNGIFDVEKKAWVFLPEYTKLEYLNGYLPLTKVQKTPTDKEYWIDNNGVVILSTKIKVLDINLKTEYAQEYLIFSKNNKRYKLEFDGRKEKFIWNIF